MVLTMMISRVPCRGSSKPFSPVSTKRSAPSLNASSFFREECENATTSSHPSPFANWMAKWLCGLLSETKTKHGAGSLPKPSNADNADAFARATQGINEDSVGGTLGQCSPCTVPHERRVHSETSAEHGRGVLEF